MSAFPNSDCVGKQAFVSLSLATRATTKRAVNGFRARAYRCEHCRLWHLGSARRAPVPKAG